MFLRHCASNFFFLLSYRAPRDLYSFSPRRSSDLSLSLSLSLSSLSLYLSLSRALSPSLVLSPPLSPSLSLSLRSEEHTSELQSFRHLVSRLLREKTIRDIGERAPVLGQRLRERYS